MRKISVKTLDERGDKAVIAGMQVASRSSYCRHAGCLTGQDHDHPGSRDDSVKSVWCPAIIPLPDHVSLMLPACNLNRLDKICKKAESEDQYCIGRA